MDRRDFVKNSLLTWGSLALPRYLEAKRMGGGSSQDPSGDAKFQVEYIRDNIPPFEIPPYRGQSYEDRVPDTLDIAERARLTIHCLTSIADPAADYEVYWAANFFQNPPIMAHDFNDWVLVCESMQEDLPLLRLATGDDLNSQVDPAWAKVLLKCLGPDGLMYVPFKGRPWSRLRGQEMDPVWRADGSKTTSADMSVRLVLPVAFPMLALPNGRLIALIKPQFEAGRAEIGKGGIVRDPAVRERVVADLHTWLHAYPVQTLGTMESPLPGRDGNIEYLWLIGPGK